MKLSPQHRLILFIALSLAIHAALLHVDNTFVEVTQHEQSGSWLQLQLKKKTADATTEQLTEESISERNSEATSQTNAEETKTALKDIASQQSQTLEASNNETESIDIATDEPVITGPDIVQVNHIITDEFTHNFYYPATARRRNWQGDVILQFTLMPDGSIEHVRINKSSGYRVLDEAAMDVMSKIKSERQLALVLNGHRLDHLLPVSYRLQDAL